MIKMQKEQHFQVKIESCNFIEKKSCDRNLEIFKRWNRIKGIWGLCLEGLKVLVFTNYSFYAKNYSFLVEIE